MPSLEGPEPKAIDKLTPGDIAGRSMNGDRQEIESSWVGVEGMRQ